MTDKQVDNEARRHSEVRLSKLPEAAFDPPTAPADVVVDDVLFEAEELVDEVNLPDVIVPKPETEVGAVKEALALILSCRHEFCANAGDKVYLLHVPRVTCCSPALVRGASGMYCSSYREFLRINIS